MHIAAITVVVSLQIPLKTVFGERFGQKTEDEC